ncbi:hypothetical protein CANINC_001426 [Pichia inconspicua]|uniref:Outer spore wall assembly protein SHE10 n=1 Tax=Pichia inconspicua TaxID=52247 RepID=A0A4T0X3V7_9ASCO|nr:hypothetical protein CANINC_001426 [[Candida] inconspicua]
MQFSRFLRWMLLITGIVFSGLYIICPNVECPSVMYVCNVADEIQNQFQPVINNYIQPVVQPVVSKVDDYYDKSMLKVYVNHAKYMTSPYTDILFDHLASAQDRISAFREQHEERIKKATYDSATNIVKVSTLFVKDTVFPTVCEACKFLYKKSKFYSFKTRLWLTIRWRIYGRPAFYSLAKKVTDSRAGDFLIKFYLDPKTQKAIELISNIVSYIKNGVNLTIQKVEEVYTTSMAFKNTETYKNLQLKTNFLWEAFNYLSNEEDSEELLSTSTITLTATVTSTTESSISASSTMSSVATAVDGVPANVKYSNLLTSTVESAANDFHARIDDLTNQFRKRLHEEVQPDLIKFNYNVETGFEEIQSAIDRINAFKNSTDSKYVSRKYFRDVLAAKKDSIESDMKKIEEKVSKISDEYVDAVYKIRVNVLETLEEFADSSLKAYSAEIVANGDSWEEWKKHTELKSYLLQFRDELIKENPSGSLINDVSEINREVNIVANDGISFLAILRAKANMEFQAREKEEREQREKAEKDETEASEKAKKETVVKSKTKKRNFKLDRDQTFSDVKETKTKTVTRQTVKTLYDHTKESSDEIKVVLDDE